MQDYSTAQDLGIQMSFPLHEVHEIDRLVNFLHAAQSLGADHFTLVDVIGPEQRVIIQPQILTPQ